MLRCWGSIEPICPNHNRYKLRTVMVGINQTIVSRKHIRKNGNWVSRNTFTNAILLRTYSNWLVNKPLGDGYHFLKLLRGSSFWNESPYGRNSDISVYPSYSCSYHKTEHKFSLTLPLPLQKKQRTQMLVFFFFRSLTSRALWPCVLFTCQLLNVP